MTIPRTTAKKLCTDVEYRLVNESFAPHVAELSEKGLAQRIKRTRAARDKYRSLAERQTREARGRIAPHGARAAAGNKNTRVKQTLFDETLSRYEKQAARLNKDAAPKRSATVAASGRKARSAAQKEGASQRASRTGSAAKTTKATKATKTAKAATQGGKATGTAKPAQAAGTRRAQSGKSAVQAAASGTKSSAASKTAGRGKVQAAAAGKRTGAQKGAADAAGTKSSPALKTSSVPEPSSASKASAASKSSVTSKSPADNGKKKAASRTPAARAGTITRPVKITPLKQVLAAVSDVVAARKETGQSAQEAPPARSPKAPAVTNDGAPPGSPAVDGVNRKGPEFPRNAHERGRVSAAFKRQQARRDSR